eukprot:symbB.v1.2.008948.t1/scaffold554.1/size187895/2
MKGYGISALNSSAILVKAIELEAAAEGFQEPGESVQYLRSALEMLEPLQANEDHRVLSALLRLPYEALNHAAKALHLPPPCLFGGNASPKEVAFAHILRARAVCQMEEADEMYYEDEGERSALLNDLLKGLEAVVQVQPDAEVKDLRRRLTRLGSKRGASSTQQVIQRSWSSAGPPAGSALMAARRRRSTSAPRLR